MQKGKPDAFDLSKEILDRVRSLVLVADKNASIVYASPSFENVLGYRPEDILGERWWKISGEDLKERARKKDYIARCARGEISLSKLPYRGVYLNRDGGRRWILWSDSHGPNHTIIGTGLDITDQVKAEQAAEEYNQRNLRILESISDGFFALDREWRFTYLNRQGEALLRRTGEQLLGRNIWEEFPEAVGSLFFKEYHRAMASQQATQFEAYYPPLETWFEVHAFPYADGLSVHFHNVTARKKMQDEVRMLAEAFRSVGEYVSITDLEDRLIFVNDAFSKAYGYPIEELIGQHIQIVRSETRSKGIFKRIGPATLKGGWKGEIWNRRKNGKEFPIFLSTSLICDESGKAVAQVGVARDVTEEKETHERLDHLNRLYAVLSQVDETLVRSREPEKLFQEACRIAVEVGGFRMAWVGRVEEPTRRVMPVARYGYDEGYLDSIVISIDDVPEGGGIVGRALRGRIHAVSNDIEHDPGMAVWSKAALERGYHSCAAFPLRLGDRFVGALALYSSEVNYFDDTKIRLLDSLAADISIALESAEREKLRTIAQQELLETNLKLTSLYEASPLAILSITTEGKILMWSKAAERIFGWKAEEVLGGGLPFVPEDQRVESQALLERVKHGEILTDVPLVRRRKDGSRIDINLFTAPMRDSRGVVRGCMALLADITERKRAEAQSRIISEIIQGVNSTSNLDELLRLIHQSLRNVLYAENCFIALYNRTTGLFEFPFFVDQFDKPPAPFKAEKSRTAYVFKSGKPLMITDAAFRDLEKQGVVELIGTASSSWLGVPLKTPMETIGVLAVQHYQNENAYDRRDLEFLNSVGSQIALAIDRKRAGENLRKSDERLLLISQATNDAVWDWDITTGHGTRSGGFQILFGYSPEEFGEDFESWKSCIHPEEREGVIRGIQETLARGDRSWSAEYRFCRKDGTYAYVFDRGYVMVNEQNKPVRMVGAMMDVSTLKETQEALRKSQEQFLQAQKMEAVGQLAGGIAHDFNNLLTAINGYSELLLGRMRENDPLRREIQEIKNAGDRAATLTHQLLAFSRRQVLQPKVLDLNSVVSGVDKMIRRLIGENIELTSSLAPDLGCVKADPGQISQVIVNLVVNARDAMPSGGRLFIDTDNTVVDASFKSGNEEIKPGQYVLLTVHDSGEGMDEETLQRAFEPFFTTKEPGKGTGLGLSTVYGIIKQSGGFVTLESQKNRGTLFRIYLPRIEETTVAPTSDADRKEQPYGLETILLVEDEEMIRELGKEVLQDRGYTVLCASNGEEALELCMDPHGRIDALLTDVVMPKMNGRLLAEAAKKLIPDLKVIYMSGYTNDVAGLQEVLDGGDSFLQKPFTAESLVHTVRQAFDV
ncbi:MAG: PAS domain S-box protein [Acidobacteriia bacterium]|nr:PAS domain S-box protein [Terriglobia bacterium]